MKTQVTLTGGILHTFDGECIASVAVKNHDDSIRRLFRVYRCQTSYVAERVDDPDTLNVRFWGAKCLVAKDLYDFFGNEPLANYLYGRMQISVPGMYCLV